VDLKPSADALEAPGPLLPAVALRRLEPPADVLQATPDAPPYYLCLSADNRCHTAAPPPATAEMTSYACSHDHCVQQSAGATSAWPYLLHGSCLCRFMLVTAKHIVGVGAHADAGSAASSSTQTAKASMHEAFVSASAGGGQAEGSGSTSGWSRLDSSAAASNEPTSTAAAALDSAEVIVNSATGAGIVSTSSSGNSHSAGEVGDSNGSGGGSGVNDLNGSGGEIVSPTELEALINEAGSAAWGEWASLPPGVQTATGVLSNMLEVFLETCMYIVEHAPVAIDFLLIYHLHRACSANLHMGSRHCCTAQVTQMPQGNSKHWC
jgi:hypothetical protein